MLILGSLHGATLYRHDLAPLDRLRELISASWGSYLAFVPASDGSHLAMVDPSGAGRAYLARNRDLCLITDTLDPVLMRNGGFAVDIDAAAIAGCVLDPGTMVTAPLLQGVVAMTPGTAYALGKGGTERMLWSPAAICADGGADSASAIRKSVDTAVSAMVGDTTPLLELSGGLDSSILAGTMIDLGIAVDAVTVELIGGDVDERRYAEVTAHRGNLQLRCERVSDYPNYASFMEATQVAHPFMYGVDDAFARAVANAVTDRTDHIVTGQGGDAVFYQPATPLTEVAPPSWTVWRLS